MTDKNKEVHSDEHHSDKAAEEELVAVTVEEPESDSEETSTSDSQSMTEIEDSEPMEGDSDSEEGKSKRRKTIIHCVKIFLPILLAFPFIFDFPGMRLKQGDLSDADFNAHHATSVAGLGILMALWWILEPIPLAVTSLLPAFILPFTGVLSGSKAAQAYFSHIQFLLIGGFIFAAAMERWNLHRRIALAVIKKVGLKPRRILAGMMIVTFALSAFISNTATSVIMVPNATVIIEKMEELSKDQSVVDNFSTTLLLGIAFSATIGGMATLIGTLPNAVFLDKFVDAFPDLEQPSFSSWLFLGLPVSLVLAVIVYVYFVVRYIPKSLKFDIPKSAFDKSLKELGPMKPAEKLISCLFIILGLLWLFANDISFTDYWTIKGWTNMFPDDSTIADGSICIAIAFLLFIIPVKNVETKKYEPVLEWDKTVKTLPWSIVMLMGGGFALGAGFSTSGLSDWIGAKLESFDKYALIVLIAVICIMVSALSNITSNTTTSIIFLSIIAPMAKSINESRIANGEKGLSPHYLMIPATLAASCSFLLPISTPPNLVVFASNRLKAKDFIKNGVIINIISLIVVIVLCPLLIGPIFGLDSPDFF